MSLSLVSGDVAVGIEPAAGGRLCSLRVYGRERLLTEPDASAELPPISWGSFAMVPWVGRMYRGHLAWGGTVKQLPLGLGGHAIHGTGFDRPWDIGSAGLTAVTLELDLAADGRWPFGGQVRQAISLEPGALELRLSVRADSEMPIAVGWHPWFRRDPGEPISVIVPAGSVLATDDDLIPSGEVVPVDERTDLRRANDVGDRRLDDAYVGVDGPCHVVWSDLDLRIEAEPLRSVLVHTTPTAVCVEPQTAWPDAIRLAAAGFASGVTVLAPGAVLEASTRWSWRRRPEGDESA